ncbi:LolA family protein [Streptomyces sp. BI20]|uniref:LolA family protein n=1 Tax=Streptomyces sp. BI20 TaxID=3403460 RepID=UPI003C78B08E
MNTANTAHDDAQGPGPAPRRPRRLSRYAVPISVAAVAAASVAMVPAFANAGGPDLPKLTAEQLIAKVADSKVETFSGSAKITTDLGLPTIASGLLGADKVTGGSADPQEKLTKLASGTHTLDLAADGPDRQKVTFRDGQDQYTVVHNGAEVWGHDSTTNEVFHEKNAGKGERGHKTADRTAPAPQELAREVLQAAGPTTAVTVGDTARVAGRDAYQLVLKPKQAGSTIGSVNIAVDAANGVPLRLQVLSSEGGKPILDAGFTKIDYAKPAADTFSFTPPKGAKVTEGSDSRAAGEGAGKDAEKGLDKALESIPGLNGIAGDPAAAGRDVRTFGEGWATVARITVPGGKGLNALEQEKEVPAEAKQFLGSLGEKVSGSFGTGRVISTRVVNALITDDGKVYVGAVTKDALVKTANTAK